MAIRFQKVLIACVPAIIAIVSFYWLRKRKKSISDRQSTHLLVSRAQSITTDSIDWSDNCVESNNKQTETFSDSLLTQNSTIDSEMQLRENKSNNNKNTGDGGCGDGDNSATTGNGECHNQADVTLSEMNKFQNSSSSSNTTSAEITMINKSVTAQLKRLKIENDELSQSYPSLHGDRANNNNNERNVTEDVEKVESNNKLDNCDNDKEPMMSEQSLESQNICHQEAVIENEINNMDIVNNGDSIDNNSEVKSNGVEEDNGVSCFKDTRSPVANGDSHNTNDKDSVTQNNGDSISEHKDMDSPHSVLSCKDFDNAQELHITSDNCLPSVVIKDTVQCNGFVMSQSNTPTIASSSSGCSSSASCQMTNGYDTDAYHNYPDSVSTSAVDHLGESPPNSAFSDNHSEGSSDSGKGGSDILHGNSVAAQSRIHNIVDGDEDPVILYQFEIPQYLCGRLIGHHGNNVNRIKEETNTRVIINLHHTREDMRICTLEGTKSEIKRALIMIRRRIQNRDLDLRQINLIQSHTSPATTYPLPLPAGILCDVILSSMVSAGHFFLQQPTHPTYPSLSRLDHCMSLNYSQIDTPQLPSVHPDMICAVPIMGGWYRGVIVKAYDTEECEVMFVDYGGYSRLPTSSLRQIRADFMTLPFQASECYLANVTPVNSEEGWTSEANLVFEELAQGQILQSNIVAYSDDGIPMVNLYKVQGVSNVFINSELVARGHAHWSEHNA